MLIKSHVTGGATPYHLGTVLCALKQQLKADNETRHKNISNVVHSAFSKKVLLRLNIALSSPRGQKWELYDSLFAGLTISVERGTW